ncbi:MAG: PhnD/SsuA/transferrin family substrate-binding protein [Halobacteriales archaeon]
MSEHHTDESTGGDETNDDHGRAGRRTRRRFIATGLATAATVGLAGCSGGGAGGGGSGDGSSGGSSGDGSSGDGSSGDGSSGDGSSGDGGSEGSSGGGATSGSDPEDVTILLTPGTPSDVRGRYEPLINMINGEIDTVDAEAKVLGSYSAIRPALKSKQAEIGMDDVTLISAPDLFEVYGTTVTGGSAFYFSVMLTNPDSGIDERTDMKGKTMAFADRLSTSGSIFATYTLKQAGLDVGEAPQGQPVDFEGVWSNHDIALKKLGNGEADAATTWGGNGLPHIPTKYKSDFPQRVLDKSSFIDTLDTEEPKFRPFWFSFPIPKQPVYARKNWDSENKGKIGELLRSADKELVEQYYPEGYNEEKLPFSTLQNTSIEDYQPVIKRLNDLGVELGG